MLVSDGEFIGLQIIKGNFKYTHIYETRFRKRDVM